MLRLLFLLSCSFVSSMDTPTARSVTRKNSDLVDHEPFGIARVTYEETRQDSNEEHFQSVPRAISTETNIDSDEERMLCNHAIDCLYKKTSYRVKSKLNPHVRRIARRRSVDRQDQINRDCFETMRRLSMDQSIEEQEHDRIHQIVGQAVEELLDEYEKKVESRWNKRRIAAFSTITTVLGSAIAAMITALSK